jgi:hypothetical protein
MPLSLSGIRGALTHLDCGGHNDLVMDATTFTASPPANQGFIGLYMLPKLSANLVLIGPNHGRPYFMQEQKSLFVTRNSKLALELNSGDACCMGCN